MDDKDDTRNKDPWTEVITRAQTEYNPPPETPREAMWAAIQSRRQRRSRFRLVLGTSPVWIPAAAAAALVLAFLAGRLSAPEPGPTERLVAQGSESPAGDDQVTEAASGAETAVSRGAENVADTSAPPEGGAEPGGRGRSTADNTAYRLAAASFLNRTETMLTRFQKANTPGVPGGADVDFAQWARVLLSETRLLLDSPAAQDPEMHGLLEDLETLLAQLVQLGDARQQEQRGWISQSMDRSGILLRMRNKIPNTVPNPGI